MTLEAIEIDGNIVIEFDAHCVVTPAWLDDGDVIA